MFEYFWQKVKFFPSSAGYIGFHFADVINDEGSDMFKYKLLFNFTG